MREVLVELGLLEESVACRCVSESKRWPRKQAGDFYGDDRDALRRRSSRRSTAARCAPPSATRTGTWRVNAWVKQGILAGLPHGRARGHVARTRRLRFFDKDTYPVRATVAEDNVRIVPGGSSMRDGAYLAPGVVCMPPMYVNVGAYVDEGTMIDSHALVGSCAQIGKRVHLSAAAQIGGVLEPVGAVPVIIEDDVLVGGSCGVYEGTIVRAGAVLAAGTILTGSTPVFDLVRDEVYRRDRRGAA